MSASPQGNGIPPKPAPEDVPQHSPIQYPAEYTFKIMGVAAEDFRSHAVALVGQVVGPIPDDRVRMNASPQGKYQSVSVSVRLDSESQRRAVYQLLWEDKRVLYYL
ncbi:MAG TPA: DUF493 domain-containing protein [Candidatus Xenobia bacterium]|jgi:hypothetical protein